MGVFFMITHITEHVTVIFGHGLCAGHFLPSYNNRSFVRTSSFRILKTITQPSYKSRPFTPGHSYNSGKLISACSVYASVGAQNIFHAFSSVALAIQS